MANHAVLLNPVATMAPCRAANVHHQLQQSSRCAFLPSLPVRGGASAKRLVARANVNSTGFWTPEAVVPNYDIWSIRKDLEMPVSAFIGKSSGKTGTPSYASERFQSVITQLFQQRFIRCGGAVDDEGQT